MFPVHVPYLEFPGPGHLLLGVVKLSVVENILEFDQRLLLILELGPLLLTLNTRS